MVTISLSFYIIEQTYTKNGTFPCILYGVVVSFHTVLKIKEYNRECFWLVEEIVVTKEEKNISYH